MSDPINLNRARKAKARAEKQVQAEQNRAKFGRTKAEREAEAAIRAKRASVLDGHRRAPGEGETEA